MTFYIMYNDNSLKLYQSIIQNYSLPNRKWHREIRKISTGSIPRIRFKPSLKFYEEECVHL